MTRNAACHLLDILAEVPDPRHKKGRRYPLVSILALIVIGLMSNHKGYTSITTWIRDQAELAKALGFKSRKTPCAATLHNLFKRLDVVGLEASLTKWAFSKLEDFQGLKTRSPLEGIAIDGKELQGSEDPETRYRTHLLSAVSHELGITLTQRAVSGKTNEIPISTQLLKTFDVAGKVITTDALLTQRTFCEEILKYHANYAMPVKENQKQMYTDIRELFEPLSETDTSDVQARRLENLHIEADAHLQTHTYVETSHGVTTTRTLTASTLLNDYIKWPGLAQVYQYHAQRVNTKTGEITHHTQYGITSLTPENASTEALLKLRRDHWTIENKVHWVRDVVLGEDASRARTGSIPHVMAALRNTALSILRFDGHTKIAETLRFFATKPKLAVKLIQ